MRPEPYLPVTYLQANAEATPNAPAVIDAERSLTFRELHQTVEGAADALRVNGLRPGDVAAVHLPNVWEHVVLELAIGALGAVVMPLPLTLGQAELREMLTRSRAALLLVPHGTEHAVPSSIRGRRAGTVRSGGSPCWRPIRPAWSRSP